jgi:flagellar hook-associated protein FlgK
VSDLLSIAASGLSAATAQLNVTANNIANMNTPGFKAQRVDLAAAPGGGVEVTGIQSTGQPVDPVDELVHLKQEGFMYGANAMMVRTGNQLFGTLIDILDTDHQRNDRGW